MKIIKQGRKPGPPTWRVTCKTCGSVLEYVQEDICGDQRDGDYVKCPCCDALINHGNANRVIEITVVPQRDDFRDKWAVDVLRRFEHFPCE